MHLQCFLNISFQCVFYAFVKPLCMKGAINKLALPKTDVNCPFCYHYNLSIGFHRYFRS